MFNLNIIMRRTYYASTSKFIFKIVKPITISFNAPLSSVSTPQKTISFAILDHFKSQHGLKSNYDRFALPTAANTADSIEKLQSIIIYARSPHAHDVISLFNSYSNAFLTTVYNSLPSKKLEEKLEMSIINALTVMNVEELHQLSLFLKRISIKQINIKFFKNIISLVCNECSKRLYDSPSLEDSIKMFLIAFDLLGTKVKKMYIFNQWLSFFEENFQFAKPLELIEIVHFMSLNESVKFKYSIQDSLKSLMPYLGEIPLVYVGILCQAYYKVGLKESKGNDIFLKNVTIFLKASLRNPCKELSQLELNAILAFVKILRRYKYQDQDLFSAIKDFIIQQPKGVSNPTIIGHLIAYSPNFNYYDKELFEACETLFLNNLSSFDKSFRIKDIDIILWAFSFVNHPCKQKFLTSLEEKIHKIAMTEDFFHFSNHFVSCAISLSILGRKPVTLANKILNEYTKEAFQESPKGRRDLTRLLILYEALKENFTSEVKIRCSRVSSKLNLLRNIGMEIEFRPAICKISKALKWLENESNGLCPFELQFVIPHINYSSLVIKNLSNNYYEPNKIVQAILSKTAHSKTLFEIEDENSCLKSEPYTPIGREILKRNLLLRDGWAIYILKQKQIDQCENDPEAFFALLLHILSFEKPYMS